MKLNSLVKKFFWGGTSVALIALIIGTLLFNVISPASAAALTTVYDRLSRVKQNLTSVVDHNIVFTPAGTVSGATDSVLVLQFPDADDAKWCATAGTDLTVAGTTEDSATALAGTLTAKCTQGAGASSFDKIYVCATVTNTWSAATKYAVQVKDGTTGKLGTAAAANDIKVSVTTGTAATCTDPTAVDTGSVALSILTDDQLAVTATVDPLFTFSISADTAIGFGTFSSTTKRYTTADETGTTTAASGVATTVTVAANAPNGALISARSKGNGTGVDGNGSAGLYKSSSPTKLIAAVGGASVTTGSEGYALYLRSIGANLAGANSFGASADDGTGATGTISTTAQTILTASGPLSTSNTAAVKLSAAIASSTTAGSYTDAVTLTGTGKF